MNLVPRTLAGRTVLLVFAAVLLSEALTFIHFGYYRRLYERERASDALVANVRMLQSVLGNLSTAGRDELMRDTESNRYRLARLDQLPNRAHDSVNPFMREIGELLKQKLDPETVIKAEARDRGLWISFSAAGKRWWLVVTQPPAPPHTPWHMFVVLAAIFGLVVGLSTAFAIHIARPLRDLTGAAEALAAGQPRPAEPAGPKEVRVLAQAFNRMLEALDRAEHERRTMLAGLPHDLRAPLARLKLRAALLEDKALHQSLTRDAEDMTRITDQFLAYLRGEAEESVQSQSLTAIVREVIEAQRLLGRDVNLEADSEAILSLRPVGMRRLVDNLLENAFQHGMSPVIISVDEEQAGVVLRVRDHGRGIPEAERARAQQPFEQLDSARGASGCGLGLAIVERIARAHRGSVTLADSPDGGLLVSVRLPTGH